MKKQMIALAVAGAFAGSAFAANVDVYGVVDTGLVYTQTEVGGVLSSAKAEGHKFSMDSGVNSGNRLGLRGTEDLGDGYSCLVSKIRLVNHRPPFNTLYSRVGGGMSLCHGSPNS